MLPIGKASIWLFFHLAVGFIALGIFWSHTRSLWPRGFYEQLLAGSFYLVAISGIVGYFFQKIFPRRLTQTGIEVIYERIPAQTAEIRKEAAALLSELPENTERETLEWFFRRPRFFFSHVLGGKKGEHWIRRHLEAVKNDRLIVLAGLKNKLDIHYAIQKILKGWLWFHAPLTLFLGILILWHVVIVHVYVL